MLEALIHKKRGNQQAENLLRKQADETGQRRQVKQRNQNRKQRRPETWPRKGGGERFIGLSTHRSERSKGRVTPTPWHPPQRLTTRACPAWQTTAHNPFQATRRRRHTVRTGPAVKGKEVDTHRLRPAKNDANVNEDRTGGQHNHQRLAAHEGKHDPANRLHKFVPRGAKRNVVDRVDRGWVNN